MDEMTIYWITRLDAFKGLFEFLCFASVISSLGFGLMSIIGSFDHDFIYDTKVLNCFKRITRISCLCATVFFLINSFFPSTKEMFAIKCIPIITSKENIEKFKGISESMLDATANYIKDLNKSR